MLGLIKNILKMSVVAIVVPGIVFGAQQPNPRNTANTRNVARSADTESNAAVRRSATSVIARSTALDKRKSSPVVTARPATARTATVRSVRPVVKSGNVARSASKPSAVRSGIKVKTSGGANVSRAGKARATAVFNDISKIGGGYSNCRDAYATCMDQICANANDTYRRCFCSDRFTEFRDTSDRLDEALKLLAEFQNVNLDAVDKTAAEVDAMYSATEGEEAIKRDTSASQKLLDSISEVLSSKKNKNSAKKNSSSTSLGVLDLSSFSTISSDPFADSSSTFGGNASSIFNSNSSYSDLSTLEGAELYESAMNQCSQITRQSCEGDALFNLARSSYSILITQDCNAYEKTIAAKKTSVEDTVRKAEKYLREARLEEYRAHNSADMNECLTKVDNAIRQQFACGPNLETCLDFTGLYITSTGEPIYSPALFDLNNVIVLDGSADVLTISKNANYLQEFESRKKSFAESALNTCRDIADAVWEEYKRMLLIQVAQAQDEKIEEVKNSCIKRVKECYDSKTGDLNSLAGEVAGSATKAISTIAARDACKNDVFACAALYGDVDGCEYDDAEKKIYANSDKTCGMQSLLALVDAVDTVKFEKGCEEALKEYVEETCAPASGDSHKYPWGCVKISPSDLKTKLIDRAKTVCNNDFGTEYSMNNTRKTDGDKSAEAGDSNGNTTKNDDLGGKLALNKGASIVDKIMENVKKDMAPLLREECAAIKTEGDLVFDADGYTLSKGDTINVSSTWARKVFGNNSLQSLVKAGVVGYGISLNGDVQKPDTSYTKDASSVGWGVCMQPSASQLCNIQKHLPGMPEDAAVFDESTGECDLKDLWYSKKCNTIGGYMSSGKCWIKK